LNEIREILGILALTSGLFFTLVGVLGLVRFPDVYMRIHASGMVSMLGVIGLLIGAVLLMPATTMKALALVILLVVGQPVASHVVASAAYRSGVPLHDPQRDDLRGALDPTTPINTEDEVSLEEK
jgi:multicomponent Na+:H+ antiporter subunit G